MSQFTSKEIEILREYAVLKTETKKIEKRMEGIKGTVKNLLVREDVRNNPVKVQGLGKFTLRPRKIWEWSEATQALENRLKEAKEYEKATGSATFEEVEDVFFTDK